MNTSSKTIKDVRQAMWDAYIDIQPEKLSECELGVLYGGLQTTTGNVRSETDFMKVECIEFYLYTIGPSGWYRVWQGDTEQQNSASDFTSVDIYQKSIDLIQQWDKDFKESISHDDT